MVTKKQGRETKKETNSNKICVVIKQVGSPIGRHYSQRQTLIGLGLNKLHRISTLEDTPSVRGMINKVKHLVKVCANKS